MEILVWGAGQRGRRSIEENWFNKCTIKGVIDTNYEKPLFMGYTVYRPNEIESLISQVDYIVILPHDCMDIYRLCLDKKLDRNKLIFYEHVDEHMEEHDIEAMKLLSDTISSNMYMVVKKPITINEKDFFDETRLIRTEEFCDKEYTSDYFRYRTFEFVANEILENNIAGEVAELGVFQGMFSALLQAKFPDKQMYLFDTFEGFSMDEASAEKEKGRINDAFIQYHRRGSVEKTLQKMRNRDNCHICKGFFPQTVTPQIAKLQFAFVSIDVDLEDTTYEGLRFFYPRMLEGGYIFVHDYNARHLSGVKAAVRHFEREEGTRLKCTPLADRAGTLVVMK